MTGGEGLTSRCTSAMNRVEVKWCVAFEEPDGNKEWDGGMFASWLFSHTPPLKILSILNRQTRTSFLLLFPVRALSKKATCAASRPSRP